METGLTRIAKMVNDDMDPYALMGTWLCEVWTVKDIFTDPSTAKRGRAKAHRRRQCQTMAKIARSLGHRAPGSTRRTMLKMA